MDEYNEMWMIVGTWWTQADMAESCGVVAVCTRNRTVVLTLYKSGNELCVAKFMPRFDGPYPIIAINE